MSAAKIPVRISYMDEATADEERLIDADNLPAVDDELDGRFGRYRVARVFIDPPKRRGGPGTYLIRVLKIRPPPPSET